MALTQVRRDTIVKPGIDVPANSSEYSCDSRIESSQSERLQLDEVAIMDCADKDLNKTSDVKREAMVSKLHNMQWLKSTLHSSNPGKARTTCKQMQDHNENSKTEDTVLLTRDGGAHLVEEFDTYSSIQNREEYTSGDIMSKSNKNMCNKDVGDLSPSVRKAIYKRDETASFTTTNLEADSCRNEKSEDINYTAQNKTDDTVQAAANSNPDKKIEPEKTDQDQDVEQIDFMKHDNNNNSEFTILSSEMDNKEMDNNKEKSSCKDVESNKIPMETKSKNMPVKLPINESKTSIKNDGGATLSKNNEKLLYTFGTDSKKSVSNLSKSTISVNKGTKTDRSNNRHAYARNIACIRREEFVKQRSVSKDGTENEKKDIAVKSSVSKTDVETELNKMFDATSQGKNTNKNKVSQKQQSVNKQFMSKTKSQESFRKSAPVSNNNKDNTLEKMENGVHASKNFELNGSEKKDQEAVGEKNSRNDQKANNGINVRRSATFVAQYKNSTFSKQTSSTPNKTEYPSTYGKNSSYTRNNSKFDRERADNVGRKVVTQKDYTPINSKFNKRSETFGANNPENHQSKRQNETNACNYKNMDPIKVETQLTENKESANSLSIDAPAEQKYSAIDEQIREEMKTTEESKVNTNQQDVIITNKVIKEINKSNDDKYTVDSQTNVTTYQHLKLENTQCTTDNTKQPENNQTWCNLVSSTIIQRNNTSANPQQTIPNMHFGMQQIGAQAEDLPRQMWAPDCGRYYEQHFATEDLTRLGHVPNMTCDAISYENNFQTAPSDADVAVPPAMLEIAIDRNRENSNALYKYNVPHVHSRPVASLSNFPGYSVSANHNNRWNSTLQEGGVHIEHPAYNVTQQLAAMQVYKSGPDDFNAHATNCLPPPIVYAPCMQTWNPQLQYPMPVFYNSSYGGYAMFSDTVPQSSEFDDSGSMHSQQSKYIAHTQMNNYARNARGYDSNGCSVQARNTVNNVPVKSNQYYKRYHDNYRTTYDVPRHAPISYPRSQQGMNYVSASGNMSQRNAHHSQNPKYYRQNVNSSTQIPKKPHDQRIQDFVCDDNALEDIPPMISPKEFITSNMNLSNRNDQFATQAYKPEFKMNPSADYRPPLWQRYNNNFRRNASCQDFSRDNGSPVSIGRGTYKNKKL